MCIRDGFRRMVLHRRKDVQLNDGIPNRVATDVRETRGTFFIQNPICKRGTYLPELFSSNIP